MDITPPPQGEWSSIQTELRIIPITAPADVWNARIDLFLALGGDWGTDSISAAEGETESEEASTQSDPTETRSR